jgi:hypothetical protein
MSTITLELDAELAGWLEGEAVKRAVSVECAAFRLLQEERMRDIGAQAIDVTIDGERWSARVPLRGLLYSGYATEWTVASAE